LRLQWVPRERQQLSCCKQSMPSCTVRLTSEI
jgi:hypothetical protein